MVTFPHDTLTLLSSGFSINFDPMVVRSEFDAGPPKVKLDRCRTMKTYRLTYHTCDCEKLETFITFFKENAANWFKWQDPCSLSDVKARFRGEPQISLQNDVLTDWNIQMELEVWC